MALLSPAKIEDFYARLAKANPKPETELQFSNAYTLLVAVLLSAQATDKGVNKATAPLFAKLKTPQAMLAFGEENLLEAVKTIGLFRQKTRNIMALSEILCRDHGGEVPESREALEALPGIGRKSANVLLNTLFGWPVIAVDTHVSRVAKRTGLAAGKTPEAIGAALEKRTPERYKRNAHHWLVLLGRYVCTARNPKCVTCPVENLCLFGEKTSS